MLYNIFAMLRRTDIKEPSIKDISQLYDVLTNEEKEKVLKNHKAIHYKKNDVIYHEGEVPDGLLCLGSGKVKVYKIGFGGRDQIVRMANPPGFIGYRAFFAEGPHVASAVVIEPCTIFYIPKALVFELLENNHKFSLNIIRSLAQELGFSRYRTVTLTQKHIRGRLAESLLVLKDIYGFEEDGITLNVFLSREDLANFSNMTTSNAIRTLSTFVNEEVIHVDGRIIRILNIEKLEKISKLG
ncbi:cAMP-binding domain of CRP or a regulatory subunit of cAMP-dependent protein kinases [Saccharicrinis carchari]|uniref:cAMP-binding domain of CRP or a regulatory subunit of cAMP-dependent protein kinases n=2 Tax=Saccharicrinis carchari TaxID=1168039 RepID=A0A521DD63_SACCC|nr:cAMP-binding domain of CRP or a regulatory subunit of cAMP-dependent protein kinases [Saccharicrinis carchari]